MRKLYREKDKAIGMRLRGMSYSQIKEKLKVSKSTLSSWLNAYPLSAERIKKLRDFSPRRIESYRNTMATKRQTRFALSFEKAKDNIGIVSKRELFVSGFVLYWAEGGKTNPNSVALGNTDPSMINIFIKWLELLGISKDRLKIKLHLYKDMDKEKSIKFWKDILDVKSSQFMKPYIKDSKLANLTYKNGFGHGTCNIIYHNTETTRYVLMGMKHVINELFSLDIRA